MKIVLTESQYNRLLKEDKDVPIEVVREFYNKNRFGFIRFKRHYANRVEMTEIVLRYELSKEVKILESKMYENTFVIEPAFATFIPPPGERHFLYTREVSDLVEKKLKLKNPPFDFRLWPIDFYGEFD